MTPTLRPFRAEDLALIVNRDGGQISREVILGQAALGPAMTAVVGARPIGCAGLVMPWPGVGSAWMVLSEDATTHMLWITRTVIAFLRMMRRANGLHRLEALALQECPKNQRWLELLGFQREMFGVAHGFLSDRRDMVRYELVDGG